MSNKGKESFDRFLKEFLDNPFQNTNERIEKGRTVLHYAAQLSDAETIKLLIELRATVNARDDEKQPDKLYEIGEGQFVGETLALGVSVFDILKPMVGDIFVIGDRRYKVNSPPLRDNSAMVWKMQALGV